MLENGCDFWPEGTWKVCCDVHDVAFANVGGIQEFLQTNWNLGYCVWNLSPLNGLVMFIGVMVGGIFYFPWKYTNGKPLMEIITGKKYDK